ncbi:hypothetical protein AC1031_014148 [Aphanomyces cochlioides]|nr:hypothetical protein AC1031_014148 [Aphanomyces cochlioides]
MKHLDMLWFAEMPQPAEWTPPKSLSGEPMVEIVARRGRVKSKLAEALPSTNQGRDDTVDLKPLEDNLTTYLQLLETHQNVVNSTVEANQPLPWKHSSIPQSVSLSLSWISMERGMIALCLACISALLAEKRDPSVVCVRDVWRKAAGYLNLAASFLPHHLGVHSTVQVWMHLCIVYAHTAEMSNVENAEECNDQIARYHSALSRSAHSECLAAHSYLSNFSSSYTLGQQLRWLLLASTCLCKITFWWNEVELYAKRPQVALGLCNAILKTKLPMPPQYPHRSNVLYTKVMQSMVASHHEALKLAMDYKSANLMQVEKDDRFEIFLKIEPLSLKTLRPFDIRPSQPDAPSTARISSPPRSPVSNEPPPSSISSIKSPLCLCNKSFRTESQPPLLPQQWTYGIEPFTPRLTRRGSSAPSLRSISNQEETPEEFPCQSPKINRNMAITKRKCCGLCERAFPMANLEGVVLMKRILDLRAQWGLHTIDSPKCSPASYLYHNVRVCALCNDILYGGNTNKKAHLPHLESSRNIREHVKHQRRISLLLHKPTAETSMKDEIGYMIHQSILNDALLLHEPANAHKYMDVTRRRGVTASQSSVLLLGVASNAINSMSRRGIHTQEEQGKWLV